MIKGYITLNKSEYTPIICNRLVQLYEIDGVTTWTKQNNETKLAEAQAKTPYRYSRRRFRYSPQEISNVRNYGQLPIVPIYANAEKRSELTRPIRSKIDILDLLFTSYANEFLNSNFIYWLISDFDGKIDDLIAVKETAEKLGIIAQRGDGKMATQTINMPYEAFEAMVERLVASIFDEAMIFNPAGLAGSTNIATAITAGQYPQIAKAAGLKRQLKKSIMTMSDIAGANIKTIDFKLHVMIDEESITRRLLGYIDRGVPLREIVSKEPLFNDDAQRIIDAIDKEMAGMDDEGDGEE